MENSHWWSGWPGAYCMKCGSDDPMELKLAGVPDDELPPDACPVSHAEFRAAMMEHAKMTEEEVIALYPWSKESGELKRWTQEELDQAKIEAEKLKKDLGWE